MRQLLPEPGEVDPYQAHLAARRAPLGRPTWVMLNVVSSIDGATAVGGVSRPLGSPADRQVFSVLRAVADVILVGARTVAAERYRTPRTTPDEQAGRRARGQRPKPRIAVVSASLDLPRDLDLFSHPDERPLVLTTTDADTSKLDEFGSLAEVIQCGEGRVDLGAALAQLGSQGRHGVPPDDRAPLVLCEGGSRLNGELIAEDLVDEVNVSLSPLTVGGSSPRLATGPNEAVRRFGLAHLWEADDMLLARYVHHRHHPIG